MTNTHTHTDTHTHTHTDTHTNQLRKMAQEKSRLETMSLLELRW